MAIYKDITCKCDKCGTYFDSKAITFIHMPEDNELKEKFLNLQVQNHICPECRNKNFEPTPFLYVDDNKKFAIIGNSYDEGVNDRIELKKEHPDYDFYISDNIFEFSNIVDALDNDFDPFTAQLICYDTKKYFEYKFKKYEVIVSSIDYKDGGYDMEVILIIRDNADNYKEKRIKVADIYNKIYDKAKMFNNGKDRFVCSSNYIRKLYSLKKNNRLEEARNTDYEFLICIDKYDYAKLAFVQSFNVGKFKQGDHVALLEYGDDQCDIDICFVDKIIHMSDYEYPYEINDLPVATYKTGNIQFETTMGSDDELNNEHLKEIVLNDFKENEDYDTFLNSNVIVPMKFEMFIEDFADAVEKDSISPDLLRQEFKTVEMGDNKYLSLYLEQSDVKDETISLKLIHDFKTALYQYFIRADQYDGILLNPETDKIKLSTQRLLNIITNKTMTNPNLMKEFVLNATEKEIQYIGQDKFNLIKEVYTSNIGLAAIREKLNLSKKETDFMLGDGYKRIKNILRSKELLNMPIENCN